MHDTSLPIKALIISFVLMAPAVLAQSNPYSNVAPPQVPQQQAVFSRDNNDGGEADFGLEMDEQAKQKYEQRENEAAENFEAIMRPQNRKHRMNPPAKDIQNINTAGSIGLLGVKSAPASRGLSVSQPMNRDLRVQNPPKLEMPLAMFEALRTQVLKLQKKNSRRMSPAVVLGAASYTGKAVPGALMLTLKLEVTLGRPDTYKTVPLAGDDVVLVSASVQGKPVAVSRRNGYHVWVTSRTGELEVKVELLVPQRGPRGSIEYDFLVDRTPVTSLSCFFPVAGLEPRISASVQSVFTPKSGGTQVESTLRPTVRIHILGLKDLGEQEGRQAKVYAESLNLLSVEEDALELFSVVRFTILYAGTKNFSLLLPKDMEVISADGVGAFRYQETKKENGDTILTGETAFPIRNRYEISLRLRRKLTKKGSVFTAPLPKCIGVERQTGWLAVEVPGKLQLEEKRKEQVSLVTVQQLPQEMVKSAVSPILKAYRYHGDNVIVQLAATRLPETEPKSASVDRVRAFTKLTSEGNIITDLRITLRNRLLPHLSLTLPPGSTISSALLDGSPFTPSKDDKGKILLALKRSSGRQGLRPFTISLVIEKQTQPMGLWGFPSLELPALDLPVSTLAWTVFVPSRNRYGSLDGDMDEQVFTGRATWHRPVMHSTWGTQNTVINQGILPPSEDETANSADAGAMPVRFKIPKVGKRMEYQRYWIEAGSPVSVSFSFVRAWLRYPAWIFLVGLAAIGLLFLSLAFKPLPPRPLPCAGAVIAFFASWGACAIGGYVSLFFIVMAGLSLVAIKFRWLSVWLDASKRWRTTLTERFRDRDHDPEKWRGWPLAKTIIVTVGICFVGLLLLGSLGPLLYLLLFPLA